MFCPIMNLLALAFADGAFKEDGIKTPEDLFKLEIPLSRVCPDMLERTRPRDE
jgi:hypothetical protein